MLGNLCVLWSAASGRRQTWVGVCVSCLRMGWGLRRGLRVAWRAARTGILNAAATDKPRGGEPPVSASIGAKRRRRGGGVPDACGMALIATRRELISLCLALRPRLSHLSYATASVKSTALQGGAAQQSTDPLNAPPKRARPPRRIVKGQNGWQSLSLGSCARAARGRTPRQERLPRWHRGRRPRSRAAVACKKRPFTLPHHV